MKKMWSKQKKIIICVLMVICMMIPTNMQAFATQNRMSNYSRSFSLSGNGATDIVNVARAQIGKTGSQLGYSEEWCADFVSDCAALANQGGVIPRNGYCPSLQSAITSAGGYEVSIGSARAGDIAFYGPGGANHVEIVYANNNGRISTIGGNSGSGGSCYARSVRDHSYQTMTITRILRPNYGQASSVLPGTVDTSWDVPANVTASHRITTYDQWGNAESNHYIDPGDRCYVAEVYTNGFVKVQYPVSGGQRWAYAKASDFSLSKKQTLPATRLSAWFSLSPMGNGVSSVRYNDLVYLCYRLETQDGKLLDGSIGNYDVKETIYKPDGSSASYTYGNNNNWIADRFASGGTYRGVVQISGDYTGSVETTLTIPQPYKVICASWFSATPMGTEVTSMEKGKEYYYCFSLVANEKGYYNQSINTEYKAAQDLYSPDGRKVGTWSNDKTDHNYIRFTATQSGNYKGITTLTGMPYGTEESTCLCKDAVKLQEISISRYPTKTTYAVGESLSTSGMVVTAKYSDGKTKNVTSYKVTGGNTNKIGKSTVTVSYSEGGVTKTASYVIQVNEASHKYGAWTVTKKATCTASGSEQRKCSVCGKVESRTVKATGHNYINKVINPTAAQQGYTLHTCLACGYSYKDNYTNVKKQLQSIVIAARPDKTVYNQNDTIDTTGLKVIANYTDGSKSEVRGWQINGNTAKSGKASVKISYTEGGITKTASYEIEVKEKAVPKENVSLTYDANGGSMSQTMQSGTKGSTIKISDERPKKSVTVSFRSNGGDQNLDSVSLQQSFMRWVYSSASGEIGYYPGDSMTLTENCTLRAQYNVARLTSLPKLQRSGYTFDGWYTQSNIPAYEGMVITGDTLLTAHWTQQSQNVDDNQSQTGNVSDWSDLIDYDDVEEPDEDDNDTYSVGDEFATDQAVYTVTEMGDDFCVEYSELFDEDVEDTYIPDTITINGTVYRVTSVGEKAFYKNRSLKKIVISGYIEKIDAKAFYGCISLKEITITSTKLKTGSIGANAFKKVNKNVRVIVPTSKYKTYKKLLKKAGIGAKAQIYKMKNL